MKAKYLFKTMASVIANHGLELILDKGHFRGGHCILNDEKKLLVNKALPVEEQNSVLARIILDLELDYSSVRPGVAAFINKFRATDTAG